MNAFKERQTRTRDEALIYEAKVLTRLQMKRKTLTRDLREVNRKIRVTQRNLRAMTTTDHANTEWLERGRISKIFGEAK